MKYLLNPNPDKMKDEIIEMFDKTIRNLQSKHDSFLGTKGEESRQSFKTGLCWAIDSIEVLKADINRLEQQPESEVIEYGKGKIIKELRAFNDDFEMDIICDRYIEQIATRITSRVIEYGKADPDKWIEHKNSGGVSEEKLSIYKVEMAYKSHITVIDSKSLIWHKACKWTEDQLSCPTPDNKLINGPISEGEIRDASENMKQSGLDSAYTEAKKIGFIFGAKWAISKETT